MAERVVDDRPSTVDVLDRVLDKGIVIDGLWDMSVGGVYLITVDARIIVASIETYLRYAPGLVLSSAPPWPGR
jgi:hypothetical protein